MPAETPDPAVGQIWADNDKRGYGRKVRIIALEPARPAEPHQRAVPACAVVEQIAGRHGWEGSLGRRTRIRLDRFKPTSTGYRFISDGSSK